MNEGTRDGQRNFSDAVQGLRVPFADRCFPPFAHGSLDKRVEARRRCPGRSDPSAEQAGIADQSPGVARRALSETGFDRVLACYGIATPRELLAGARSGRRCACGEPNREPTAIKIVSPDCLHKTEAGFCVQARVSKPEEARTAAAHIRESCFRYAPQARSTASGVASTVPAARRESYPASINYRQFSVRWLRAGLGGIRVEIDRCSCGGASRHGEQSARAMLASLQGLCACLKGFRGKPCVDVDVCRHDICRPIRTRMTCRM